MKLIGTVLFLIALTSGGAVAEEKHDRPPLPDGTVPLTDRPDGPAKTALPEQAADPKGTSERPGSAASRKADEIK